MNYSLPGSSVHRIFQARVLEWGAIAFSFHYLHMSPNNIQWDKTKDFLLLVKFWHQASEGMK